MKKTLMIVGMLSMAFSYGQEGRVGINTENPNATLEVSGVPTNTSVLDGIIAPKITGDQLKAKTYTTDQTGALVYVTEGASTANQVGQTVNVSGAGYYYFDGSVWQTFKGGAGSNEYLAGQGMLLDGNTFSRTGLEEVVVNGKRGYRLVGSPSYAHTGMGNGAIDLSTLGVLGAVEDEEYRVLEEENGMVFGAVGDFSFVAGELVGAKGYGSVAMGTIVQAQGQQSIAIGTDIVAKGHQSAVLGSQSSIANGNGSVVVGGFGNEANGKESFASGRETKAIGKNSVTMGYRTQSSGDYAIALGREAEASGVGAIALGTGLESAGENAIVLGLSARATGAKSIAIGAVHSGENIDATGDYSIVLGTGQSKNLGSTVVGRGRDSSNNIVNGAYAVAIGNVGQVNTNSSVVVGMKNFSTDGMDYANDSALATKANNKDLELFVVGNEGGTNNAINEGNALIVLRSAHTGIGLDTDYATPANSKPTEMLDVNGNVRVRGNGAITEGGTCSNNGTISYHNGDFFGCGNGVWKKLHN